MMDLSTIAGLALSTLVSEDLASIAAGLLTREGYLPLAHAIGACVVGVYVGDLALWAAGRTLGRRVLALRWIPVRLDAAALATLSASIDKRLAVIVLVSRLVPGSRLPSYLAAGIWGRRPFAFVIWSLVAVLTWTPLLVASTARFGDAVIVRALDGAEAGLLGSLLVAAIVLGSLKLVGWGAARAARRYHHRLDQTMDTPI